MSPKATLALALSATLGISPAIAAQTGRMTAADYDRAVNQLSQNLTGLVIGGTVTANWLPDGRFWYRAQTATGTEFRLIAPANKRMAPAFDHQRLASSLSTASGTAVNAVQFPFQQIDFNSRMDSVTFDLGQRRFRCDVAGNGCVAAGSAVGGGRGGRGGGRQGNAGAGRGNAGWRCVRRAGGSGISGAR